MDEKWADQDCRPLEFYAGDKVLTKLKSKQFRFLGNMDQRHVRKYGGPIKVIRWSERHHMKFNCLHG